MSTSYYTWLTQAQNSWWRSQTRPRLMSRSATSQQYPCRDSNYLHRVVCSLTTTAPSVLKSLRYLQSTLKSSSQVCWLSCLAGKIDWGDQFTSSRSSTPTVTISSYAYHTWTDPTFFFQTLDVILTSLWHHPHLWHHHYIIMTSLLTYDLILLHYDVITRTL